MPRRWWCIGIVGCLLLVGCTSHRRYFQPAERVRGATVEGYREALYPLETEAGRFGEAKVWSRGAILTMHEGAERTALHTALVVLNRSKAPIDVDVAELRLEVVHTDDGPLAEIPPHGAESVRVAPGSIVEAHFHFLLPPGITPGDVEAFLLRWSARSGEHTYAQRTPFARARRSRDHAHVVYMHSGWLHPYPGYYHHHYHCFPHCGYYRGRGNVTRVRAK